jgi:hypothetical protein
VTCGMQLMDALRADDLEWLLRSIATQSQQRWRNMAIGEQEGEAHDATT